MNCTARIIGVCLLFLSHSPLLAQQNAAEPPPTREEVTRFLELMRTRTQMTLLIDGMMESFKTGFTEQMKKNMLSQATSEQLASFDEFMEAVFEDARAEISVDELLEAGIPVYQKYLSSRDLQQLIAFYSSPVGQKVLRVLPAMMTESMEAGNAVMQRRMAGLEAKLQGRVAEFRRKIEADSKKQ